MSIIQGAFTQCTTPDGNAGSLDAWHWTLPCSVNAPLGLCRYVGVPVPHDAVPYAIVRQIAEEIEPSLISVAVPLWQCMC